MANSTSPIDQIAEGTGAVAAINENFDAGSNAMTGGRRASTSGLLVWGYYGGRVEGVNVANGTLTLGASTTSYVVMKKSDGVVSFATTTTNWNDSTNYWRLYSVVTGASTVTSYVDERLSSTGLFGGGGGGGGGSFTGGTLTSALNEAPLLTIASSSTPAIGAAAANSISITGTTTITGFDTIASGARRLLVFAGALTLTHNGTSLILPTGSSITTAAGDAAMFVSLGSGNWRCINYMRSSGNALAGAAFSGGTLTGALNEAPQVALASASTVSIGAAAANTVTVSGTTTITAFDSIAAGAIRRVRFLAALTLTHNATSLILPGSSNITTAAGDVAFMESLGTGNWRCITYFKADGTSVVGGGGGGGLTGFNGSLATASPNASVNFAQLLAATASADGGLSISPKGNGPLTMQVPDSTALGGNIRGSRALDLQTSRASAAQVASGADSIAIGQSNTASNTYAIAIGNLNVASNTFSVAIGRSNTSSGNQSATFGSTNTASASNAVGIGAGNNANAASATAIGDSNTADGIYSIALGNYSRSWGSDGVMAFSSGRIGVTGDTTVRSATLSVAVGGVGPVNMRSGNSASKYFLIPDKMSVDFQIRVVARLTTGDTKTWKIEGAAKRVGGTLSLVGTPTVTALFADAAMASASVAVSADNTNKIISLEYTGPASTTSYVNALITQTEVMTP